jgi:hypothetical protein
MLEVLDKNLKLMYLVNDNEPNSYYISLQGDPKCAIDVSYIDNDALFKLSLQENCSVEDIDIILDKFSDYFLNTNENINGIRLYADPTDLLEQIGFVLENNNDEFLYRKRNRKIKRG